MIKKPLIIITSSLLLGGCLGMALLLLDPQSLINRLNRKDENPIISKIKTHQIIKQKIGKKTISPGKKESTLKEQFADTNSKSGNNNNRSISRDDCAAMTGKSSFRFYLDKTDAETIYNIYGKLIPITVNPESESCVIEQEIILDQDIEAFFYSDDGKPIVKNTKHWSLEKIEGCNSDNEYIPDCKILAQYTKEIFVEDNKEGEVSREEYSVHHRQPQETWLDGNCQLIHGSHKGVCNRYYSQEQLNKYRRYIVESEDDESLEVYLLNKKVLLD